MTFNHKVVGSNPIDCMTYNHKVVGSNPIDCMTCNHKVVGPNPQLTVDFIITRINILN